MDYIEELQLFSPSTMQEEKDKKTMERYIQMFPNNILTRDNEFAHFTASSMILNEQRDKVLMVYHNIYRSWSWTGGHADGDVDFLEVSIKEAREETGIKNITALKKQMITVDILPVWGHVKNGSYVSAHQHLNYTYLLMADEQEDLTIKEDENSGVSWIEIKRLEEFVTEPQMLPVYKKIVDKRSPGLL